MSTNRGGGIVKNYRRQDLIKLCEDGVVAHKRWDDRYSAETQRQLGEVWALLKAGCDFEILHEKGGLDTDADTVWVEITLTDFMGFELGVDNNAKEHFYIPTRERLNKNKGMDWY